MNGWRLVPNDSSFDVSRPFVLAFTCSSSYTTPTLRTKPKGERSDEEGMDAYGAVPPGNSYDNHSCNGSWYCKPLSNKDWNVLLFWIPRQPGASRQESALTHTTLVVSQVTCFHKRPKFGPKEVILTILKQVLYSAKNLWGDKFCDFHDLLFTLGTVGQSPWVRSLEWWHFLPPHNELSLSSW